MPENMPEAPQPFTAVEALIPIVSLILLITLSCYRFSDAGGREPNQVALMVTTMLAGFIDWRRSHTRDARHDAAVASVSKPPPAPAGTAGQ